MLLIFSVIPLLITIALINLYKKQSLKHILKNAITTIVIYISAICFFSILFNLRLINLFQGELEPSTNTSKHITDQFTELKLYLLIGITIPALYWIIKKHYILKILNIKYDSETTPKK